MKPYYQHGGIEIYHADVRDVLRGGEDARKEAHHINVATHYGGFIVVKVAS